MAKKRKVVPGVHVIRRTKHYGWWVLYKKVHTGPLNTEAGFHTQREAIQAGRELAKAMACELLIHGVNGRIREKNSYGKDPKTRKG